MPTNIHHFGVQFHICIDSASCDNACGRVYSRCMKRPLDFKDIGWMILRLNYILDVRNFPQAYQTLRSFTDRSAAKEKSKTYAAITDDECMNSEDISAHKGALTSLDIQVVSRRNATWQGQLRLQDGRSYDFKSVDMLMRLINDLVLSGLAPA